MQDMYITGLTLETCQRSCMLDGTRQHERDHTDQESTVSGLKELDNQAGIYYPSDVRNIVYSLWNQLNDATG